MGSWGTPSRRRQYDSHLQQSSVVLELGEKMREPTRKEDAQNLSVIAGAGLLSLACTMALWANAAPHQHRSYTVSIPADVPVVAPAPLVERSEGPALDSRLYGNVVTRSGQEFEGYIRWDRNEGSWADLLDVDRKGRRSALSGIRFGHVRRIDVLNSRAALFTLKSGQQQELGSHRADLGRGMRALVVDDPRQGIAELKWRDLEAVEFMAAPDGITPRGERLYGTLATRAGLEFTGYVTWDVDEIFTTDILDGDDGEGVRQEIAFGDIASIHRANSRSGRVVLESGEEMVLSGTNDVDRTNKGISVSDLALGQVKVEWKDFSAVHFSDAPVEATYEDFDGGRLIRGTVVTESGDELTGEIRWDNDEEYTWEMLDGDYKGIDFTVEFSQIASIAKRGYSAEVVLLDGRTFRLSGSNDVNLGNRGITIRADDGSVHEVSWDDFVRLRLSR